MKKFKLQDLDKMMQALVEEPEVQPQQNMQSMVEMLRKKRPLPRIPKL